MLVRGTKYALRAKRGQRLKGVIGGTIVTNLQNNWEEMLFGTTNGTSMDNVQFAICTTAGNLMNILSTLKNDMDKASCKTLIDYTMYLKNGPSKKSSPLQ